MWLLLIRNRTRILNLERRLADAEKMAAVGTLAAGVAHEIRNPLAALRGFAQYFAKKLSGVKPDKEYAETMVREADRLNRVITDLLYLAGPKNMLPGVVDLELVAGDVARLLQFDLDSRRISLDMKLEARTILADADALKQALLNLVLNSADAVSEKSFSLSEHGSIIIRSYIQDSFTVLEVEDNGVGMDKDGQNKAFEAFFTKKANGIGLGLAFVKKTMNEHDGIARLESEAGLWCRVSLLFPTAAA